MDTISTNITTKTPEETREIGKTLGYRANPGDVFFLIGDLGSGKTTLTQGISKGLKIDDYVRSPTFVLISEYNGRLPLFHMDLYRIDKLDDLDELGLIEHFEGDGLTVVEWADRLPENSNLDVLQIYIERQKDESRQMTLTSDSRRYIDHIKKVAV